MTERKRTRDTSDRARGQAGVPAGVPAGVEGAAEHAAGVVRREGVEGGEELSIGGGPPSAAGGTPGAGLDPAPPRRA